MELDFLQENIDVSNLSNFKTRAISRYYFEINNLEDVSRLKNINDFCKYKKINTLFVGGGTNLLFAFDRYDGVIVKNNLNGWFYDEKTKILDSFSNERISDISKDLELKYNQNIWHRFIGLPGTVGGAVYGNAGCFGLETENNFLEASVYDLETGKIEIFNKMNMKFSYRSSIFKELNNTYFIISIKFDLSKKIEKYHSDVDNIYFRENNQPKGNTCGSFFKNPSKDFSAGFLIEKAGLKGYEFNGAYFSDIHANFLVNKNGTYRDLLHLINLAIVSVKDIMDIELVPEVRIIYNNIENKNGKA